MKITTVRQTSLSFSDALHQHGFLELKNALPSQDFFDLIYATFDEFIELVESKPEFRQQLEQLFEDWQQYSDNGRRYSHIPQKFVDRTQRADKANKVYYQCFLDFVLYTEAKANFLYQQFPVLKRFHTHFKTVHFLTAQLFNNLLETLEQEHVGISEYFQETQHPMPILIKILRYNQDADFATRPHCDKSALTLILNNTDVNNENLIIAPQGTTHISKFRKISGKGNNSLAASSSALALAGLCLRAIGYDIPPAPHAVLPAKSCHRHSMIAFLLVPYLPLDSLQTNVLFVDDTVRVNLN
jgi:hypothetical protein